MSEQEPQLLSEPKNWSKIFAGIVDDYLPPEPESTEDRYNFYGENSMVLAAHVLFKREVVLIDGVQASTHSIDLLSHEEESLAKTGLERQAGVEDEFYSSSRGKIIYKGTRPFVVVNAFNWVRDNKDVIRKPGNLSRGVGVALVH